MNAHRMYLDHPLVGVLCVVWKDGRVLMARRTKNPKAGFWGFPGGMVDHGEPLGEAAARELREETGIIARPRESFLALDAITHDDSGEVQFHYVLAAVLLEYESGEAAASSDVDRVLWCDPDSLPAPVCEDVDLVVQRSRCLLESERPA